MFDDGPHNHLQPMTPQRASMSRPSLPVELPACSDSPHRHISHSRKSLLEQLLLLGVADEELSELFASEGTITISISHLESSLESLLGHLGGGGEELCLDGAEAVSGLAFIELLVPM